MFFVCNVVIAAVIFTAEVKMGGTLNAADVFTVMTLVNIVQFTMTKFFSLGIMGVSEVLVSINRIQNFLQYPERKLRPEADGPTSDNPFAIDLDGVTCHWDDDLELPVAVRDVTLKVKPNTLHFVIGPVGSGKSALLQCILSELEPLQGTAKVNGSLAYAAQQPFIISCTIQENICFGRPFDAGFYKRVVASVGLDVDFVRLPQGDKTLIGDRGVNLSGGQKARVGLARAIYSRASVVLLDDVLSAVDAEVARKIFYKAVVGLLIKEGGATVVLVSHQHQFCAEGGSVNVLMVDGAVVHVGSYKDCISASEGKLSATMADDGKKGGVRSRLRTLSDPSDQADDADKDDVLEADKAQAGAKESRETGKISGKTFWSYARAMGEGGLMTFWVVLVMILGGQVMLILTLTELGEWGEQVRVSQKLILSMMCAANTSVAAANFSVISNITSSVSPMTALHVAERGRSAKRRTDHQNLVVLRLHHPPQFLQDDLRIPLLHQRGQVLTRQDDEDGPQGQDQLLRHEPLGSHLEPLQRRRRHHG